MKFFDAIKAHVSGTGPAQSCKLAVVPEQVGLDEKPSFAGSSRAKPGPACAPELRSRRDPARGVPPCKLRVLPETL